MEFVDLRALGDASLPAADMCVIGSGPAGLALAEDLGGAGVRVVVIESGGHDDTPDADELNEVENVGDPRAVDQRAVRRRTFGGTSSVWSGRIATFDELDFSERPWIPNSGWPIPRTALKDFWGPAAAWLGSPIADNTAPHAVDDLGLGLPPIGGDLIPYAWSFKQRVLSRDEPRYGPLAERRNVPMTVLLHATVTQLITGERGDHVDGVEIAAPDGRRRVLRAPRIVLCGGGIENARILLASDRVDARGVGNAHDQVGRYFMDHLRGIVATFDHVDPIAMHRLSADAFRRRGLLRGRVKPGIALSPQAQEREGLLNSAAYIDVVPSRTDPVNRALRLAHREGDARDVVGLARDWPLVARGVGSIVLRRRAPIQRISGALLECIVEQPPVASNRIMLSDRVDANGTPIAKIDWHVGDLERRTVLAFTEAVAAEFRRLGIADTHVDQSIFADGRLGLPDVAHPTGSTRMSAGPENGVVDTDCRVHGVDNLWIAGSSVFPTSGHANPTQTLVALSLRLAHHLRTRRS